MTKAGADAKFQSVMMLVGEALLAFGYRKSGAILRKIAGSNAAIIEFQKSRDSSREVVQFTINLAIVCGKLLDPDRASLGKAKAMEGHFRMRIGEALPGNEDLWWNIAADSNAEALAHEISRTLIERAVPLLASFEDTRELLALWKSGSSPGLTDVQRARYISELQAVL
jgi:hypothetical protein